jgi:methyl-accepting chemotaxis protein
VPESCPEKLHRDVDKKQAKSETIWDNFLKSSEVIVEETGDISGMIKGINEKMLDVTDAISSYDQMITDIERISEKVNIISLNASVEAAKAGKHGLAFDVVAKEIRSLAQSSANSAAKTKVASEKANRAMKTVNESVQKIDEKMQASYETIMKISNNTKQLLHEQTQ